MTQPPSLSKQALVSLTLATLLLTPLFQRFTNAGNRLEYAWQAQDGQTMVLLALGLAGGLFVGYRLLLIARIPTIIRRSVYVGIVSLALMAIIYGLQASYASWSLPVQRAILLLSGATLFSAALFSPFQETVRKGLQHALLFFSPLFGVLAVQFLSFPSLRPPEEKFVVRETPRDAAPVFFLIFDEWSYQRSFDKGELGAEFPALREFSAHATTFHRAYSPAMSTKRSLPGLIYQTSRPILFNNREYYLHQEDGRITPAMESESLFSLAKKQHYNTAYLGFYIYARLLAGQGLDYSSTAPISLKGDRLRDTFVLFCLKGFDSIVLKVAERVASFSPGLSERSFPYLSPYRERLAKQSYDYNRNLNHRIVELLSQCGGNVFVMAHYCLPHFPNALEVDGSFRRARLISDNNSESAYQRNLHGLDLAFGQLISQLKEHQRYDEAMIIVTSDHSWREDPSPAEGDEEERLRHVPLFIKLPHQTQPRQVHSKVETNRLQPIVEAVLRGEAGRMVAELDAFADDPEPL